MTMRSGALLDCPQHVCPLRPRGRGTCVSRLCQKIAAIEEETRVDVPRHAVSRLIDDVCLPNAGEVIAGVDHGRLYGIERVKGDKFRQPSVSELGYVG